MGETPCLSCFSGGKPRLIKGFRESTKYTDAKHPKHHAPERLMYMVMSVADVRTLRPRTKAEKIFRTALRHWRLHAMLIPAMVYYTLFELFPLYGLQIAFRDYRAKLGIWDSVWMGLDNFQQFFAYYKWPQFTMNTLALSLYTIGVGFPIPIVLALILHINERKILKKVVQNVSYLPHFISTVVMIGLLNVVLNPISGLLGSLAALFGITITEDIRQSADAFRHLYVWSGVWQSMGWSSILYVAALSGVSQELHEAAKIDGASRLRRIFSVDLPAIMPTIAIMLIMRFGGIMSVGYQKAYLMQNDLNLEKSEIISTYVYKFGLGANNMSYGSAVGLMNSVINSSMVVLVNKIAGWLTDGEAGLF